MTEVVIRNKEFLATLDSFVEEFRSEPDYLDPKYQRFSSEEDKERGEYFCSEEFLREQMARPDLVGAPDRHWAQPIAHMAKVDPKWNDIKKKVKHDFAAEIGAHTSALLSYYPPGGFVCWHTNHDANAYQILFTWSKDGDGYFKYYDKEKDEIVTIQDKKGWQARHYYFGREDEPEHHCWHSAYAGGERLTLAYKFCGYGINDPRDQMARNMRDMLIEEIESA